MTQKLPQESLRPGMFISVGPSGFTISGLIGMGQSIGKVVSPDFMDGNGELAGAVSMIMANWVGIWLWGLAIWFFIVSAGAHWSCVGHGKMHFAMTWFSYIFPNTGKFVPTSKHRYSSVLIGLSSHDRYVRRWPRSRQQAHQNSRLCHGLPPNLRLVLRVREHDSRRHLGRNSLAAEAGRPRRGRMEDGCGPKASSRRRRRDLGVYPKSGNG